MLDTTKQTLRWRLLLFFPSFVTMLVFSVDARLLEKVVWYLVALNVLCSFLAARKAVTPSNHRSWHFLKVAVLATLLFILNVIVGFFAGCSCAGMTSSLRR